METSKIIVEVQVNAGLSETWKCWTSPEHIVKWNFASDDWHCPSAENDPRTGGKFRATMAARDGSMSFDFEGVYDEVIPEKIIRYSLGDTRKVSVRFEHANGVTRVVEEFDPEQIHSLEMQRAGWQSILDNFKKHTESQS